MAKRAFVSVILALAHAYKLVANINRDSDDASILKMYRRVLLKVHPDKGGKKTDGSRWVSTWTTTCTDYSHFALHVTQRSCRASVRCLPGGAQRQVRPPRLRRCSGNRRGPEWPRPALAMPTRATSSQSLQESTTIPENRRQRGSTTLSARTTFFIWCGSMLRGRARASLRAGGGPVPQNPHPTHASDIVKE